MSDSSRIGIGFSLSLCGPLALGSSESSRCALTLASVHEHHSDAKVEVHEH